MIVNSVVWQGVSSLAMGVGCGLTEFICRSTVQKVAMVGAGLNVEPSLDPDDGPQLLPYEQLDKEFSVSVIAAPVIEEIVFRGLLQPVLAYGITCAFPQLATPIVLGVNSATLTSIAITSIGFGAGHYPNFSKGGVFPCVAAAVAGIVFGVARDRFGLIASIGAHMTANLCTGLLDKYWPELLEFPVEKELRLLPPRQRELRLLKEAVARIDQAVPHSSPDDVKKLKSLRSGWVKQMSVLETN